MTEIKHIAVLGAGAMGGGIAGICANAGCRVLLLDVEKSSAIAAKEKLAAGRAPVVEDAALLDNIATGTFADDLDKIADCQWICEAIIEDLEVKREMFARVEKLRADGSIVTTNTSGIPLKSIYAEMPARLQADIAVTHFFNPAHVMKLVELVPGENTRTDTIESLRDFLANRLNKGVVDAKDTVNFIGNRIGCFWMLAGLHLAEKAMRDDGLTIESIDAITSAPLGLPATGLYGLIDLIGLDVMHKVGKNLAANLPSDDFGRKFVDFTDHVQRLHDRGQLGRKSGGGFYKLTRHDDGSKSMEVFDLENDGWRDFAAVELPDAEQTLTGLFAADSAHGRFTRDLLATTLCYAADLVPQIADDIVNIDRAMRWGFNWQHGPFEMIDLLGADKLFKLLAEHNKSTPRMLRVLEQSGETSFYRNDGGEFLTVDGAWAEVSK